MDLTPEVRELLVKQPNVPEKDERGEPTEDDIRDALDGHGGSVAKAWKELGLKSRYALYRLMKKLDIPAKR